MFFTSRRGAERGSCSSRRMCKPAHSFVRRFKRGDGLFAFDGRKRVEEFLKAVAPLQVVDEIPEGNARSDEHRDAATDLRIAVNDVCDTERVERPAVILRQAQTQFTHLSDRPGEDSSRRIVTLMASGLRSRFQANAF